MEHSNNPNLPPRRRLVEFEDYPTFVGTRLFPRAGNLTLVGSVLYILFSPVDWMLTQGKESLVFMLVHRALGLVCLIAMTLVLKGKPRASTKAIVTLYLGIATFLFIVMGYLIYVPQLPLVAFVMIFFNFGVLFIGPLLPYALFPFRSSWVLQFTTPKKI